MKTIVVVGNGMVGFRLCELLASAGATRRFRVRVFGSEPVPAYDRVRLARLLGDGRAEDLQLAPRGWYEARGIDLVTGDPVIAIDRDRCTVTTLAGRNVRYDRLVLATGSRPVVPPIRGSDSRGVTALRTLDDARFVRERVAHMGAQVAILGGGLLGVEAACALRDVGVVPCVVEAGERLLPRHLDDVCAGALERRLEARGISVRTGVSARRIAKKRGNLVVSLDTGSSILADAVVIAAGIRARDGLAKGADLAVDDGGGVRVDDRMRCSDPRVLAVGECASHQGVRYGVVGPGYEMARVAADTLLGRRSRFRPPRPGYRLKVPGIEVAVVGAGCAGEATHSYRMRKGGRSVAVERGRVVGACTVGGWDELPALEESIARGARVRPRQLDRFGEHGLLGLARRRASRLPDAAVVCRCAGVTRGALARAAPTCAGPAEVAAQTGAGQSCGSCLPLVA